MENLTVCKVGVSLADDTINTVIPPFINGVDMKTVVQTVAPVAAYAAPVAATVAPVAPVAATVAPVAPVAPVAATVAPVALSALETIKASIVREALTNDDLNAIISLCIQEQARLATTKG